MDNFQYGPFEFNLTAKLNVGGDQAERWEMLYSHQFIAEGVVYSPAAKSAVIEHFAQARADFISKHKTPIAPAGSPLGHGYMVRLHESTAVTGVKGREIDSFLCLAPIDGLAGAIIDDRSPSWLVADFGFCVPMETQEFYRLKTAHEAIAAALTEPRTVPAQPPLAWVAELLPDAVMTDDPAEWRSPTSWEIRHIVGEGSFSGLSGAKAAALVGVQPQGFRKYMAADGASSRQNISYAMWHLLLQKIGVTGGGN